MALWRWLPLIGLATSLPSDRPEVTAPVGRLRGISEGEVHVFRGIPYAQAPLGELRWRPPVPFEPWQGVRDASHYGNRCMSAGDKESREDCLFLNVYTPRETSETTLQLPCLVWIHGGGFEYGSSDLYNGSSLANFWSSQQSPALLVTINYRLNIFGFLGSDKLRYRDPLKSTGNYGIQDQRMALRWVQENIGAFGGDPKKVTIFGQSAGAGSVADLAEIFRRFARDFRMNPSTQVAPDQPFRLEFFSAFNQITKDIDATLPSLLTDGVTTMNFLLTVRCEESEACSSSGHSDDDMEDTSEEHLPCGGLTPLLMALATGRDDLARDFRHIGAEEPDLVPKTSSLRQAVTQGKVLDMARHLIAGADPDLPLRRGEGIRATENGTLLHACAANHKLPGMYELAQLLIHKKANLDAGDSEGDTPLAHARYFNAPDLYKLYSGSGATLAGPFYAAARWEQHGNQALRHYFGRLQQKQVHFSPFTLCPLREGARVSVRQCAAELCSALVEPQGAAEAEKERLVGSPFCFLDLHSKITPWHCWLVSPETSLKRPLSSETPAKLCHADAMLAMSMIESISYGNVNLMIQT
eukprot:s502_g2.t1